MKQVETRYVIKCLDALDYERWLGSVKTKNLDGKSTPGYAVPGQPGKEYIWDWQQTEDTITYATKEHADRAMDSLPGKPSKMWCTKIEVPK